MEQVGNTPDLVRSFNRGRDAERLALKLRKMRQDPFSFLRGSCHLFYDDWPQESELARGPRTWICGDLHLENFGSYHGDNRLAYFDLNDFDEACLAPCGNDLVRLATSVLLAGHGLGAGPAVARELAGELLRAYAQELSMGKARWIERATSTGLVRRLLRGLKRRDRVRFLDSRTRLTRGGRRFRIDGVHSLAAVDLDMECVRGLMEGLTTGPHVPGSLRVLDVVRRVAGTGSLGLQRFAVLVEGHGSPDGNVLLDLKEAAPSAVRGRSRSRAALGGDEAQRVVRLQRLLQAISPAFLMAVQYNNQGFILRELQPVEDRVDLVAAGGRVRTLEHELRSFACLTAWAHLRGAARMGAATTAEQLMSFGADPSWREPLLDFAEQRQAKTLTQWKEYCVAYDQGFFA